MLRVAPPLANSNPCLAGRSHIADQKNIAAVKLINGGPGAGESRKKVSVAFKKRRKVSRSSEGKNIFEKTDKRDL